MPPLRETKDSARTTSERETRSTSERETRSPGPVHAGQDAGSPHALQAWLASRQAEIVLQQRQLQKSWESVGALVSRYMAEDAAVPCRGVRRVRGSAAVGDRLNELMDMTEREALCFVPGGPRPEADWAATASSAGRVLARSVPVRIICSDRVRRTQGAAGHHPDISARGAEIRTVPHLSFRVHITDRRAALVQLPGKDAFGDALVTEEPAVMAVLSSFFDAMWASATPLDSGGLKHASVTEQERELLRLLGQGLTDEAAARKLGVSLRTERRMLTKLSDVLDARSRFQLGRRAAEAGVF